MGMYTEIYVNVDLKEDTPDEVINILKAMVARQFGSDVLKGCPDCWGVLFQSGSYYTPNTSAAQLVEVDLSGKIWRSLLGKGDIKNYDNEIERFFNFIMPWVDAREGEFIGYSRYEEDLEPKLFFKAGE